eukprot:TRINITY_DN5166_c0_g1_i1.p2 TRINITY_DN5166_c0_g1~~TRINITY_DN5166_c0_g1_i1.p2  ORF type:complete len:206 (-),score=53.48 TRINITY_DN5166_c0_g1_i1:661-1278(-)
MERIFKQNNESQERMMNLFLQSQTKMCEAVTQLCAHLGSTQDGTKRSRSNSKLESDLETEDTKPKKKRGRPPKKAKPEDPESPDVPDEMEEDPKSEKTDPSELCAKFIRIATQCGWNEVKALNLMKRDEMVQWCKASDLPFNNQSKGAMFRSLEQTYREWKVKRIVERKKDGQGKFSYLVEWEGFPETSWSDDSDLKTIWEEQEK